MDRPSFRVKRVQPGEDTTPKKKTRWNLYNSNHKVPSQMYKENYDRIFRKDSGDETEKEDPMA